MKKILPKIYFYIPQEYWPIGGVPQAANTYWCDFNRGITPGVYAWTIQTYQYLKADGLNCEMVGEMPSEGIIFAHRKSLPDDFQPNSKLLIVCLKAESSAHPYAQIHIVGNHRDLDYQTMILGDRYLYPGCKYYIPHWPQPGLIPRDSKRGNRFENIAFFGESQNLAPELRYLSWEQKLREMGLKWHLVGRDKSHTWNDYSYVDAIVAVRQFNRPVNYTWKPALKLYNAWHAGVPAILGEESAYQEARENQWDYLEVKSFDDLIEALEELQKNTELKQKMLENARNRAAKINSTQITQIWQNLIAEKIIPAYDNWCNNSLNRQIFLQKRSLAIKTREQRKQLQQLRNTLAIGTKLRSMIKF